MLGGVNPPAFALDSTRVSNEMPTSSMQDLVRPLGTSEYLTHQFSKSHSMNFTLGAEFPVVLTPEQLRVALSAAQERHPLLSAHIDDCPGSGLGFYRSPTAIPIELTVLRQTMNGWTQAASAELSRPIETSSAPLMRAVLIQDTASSMVLLTFDHAIADGMGAVFLLKDLVAALNGRELAPLPVPEQQEKLIAGVSLPPAEDRLGEPSGGDPRMAAPGGRSRATRGIPLPPVQNLELDVELTGRIVERCRIEGTTVHSLLVAVASRVTGTLDGKDFVRVMSPVNHRRLTGAGEGVASYSCAGRSQPHDGTPLWEQARAVRAELSPLGSLAGIATAVAAIDEAFPGDVDPDTLAEMVTNGPGNELSVTNLGVVGLGPAEQIHPTRVVGPLIASYVEGQEIVSVATFAGRMQICGVSHGIRDEFFTELRQGLVDAVS